MDNTKAAIEILLSQVKDGMKSDDALKITQAALNLAHVWLSLKTQD